MRGNSGPRNRNKFQCKFHRRLPPTAHSGPQAPAESSRISGAPEWWALPHSAAGLAPEGSRRRWPQRGFGADRLPGCQEVTEKRELVSSHQVPGQIRSAARTPGRTHALRLERRRRFTGRAEEAGKRGQVRKRGSWRAPPSPSSFRCTFSLPAPDSQPSLAPPSPAPPLAPAPPKAPSLPPPHGPSGCGQQVAPLAAQRLPPVLGLRKERRLTSSVRFGSGTLWRGERGAASGRGVSWRRRGWRPAAALSAANPPVNLARRRQYSQSVRQSSQFVNPIGQTVSQFNESVSQCRQSACW